MQLNPFKKDFYTNPAEVGMPYLEQIPGQISPYYEPYIGAGGNALQTLMQQYGNLVQNPGGQLASLGEGFQASPGYQYQLNQGMNAANSAAAAGGMLGTPYHQTNAATMASNLANQDYNNYLQNALGLYQTGLGGYGNINQMGYGASNELAGSLASNLMNQGNLAMYGQANQNQANADLFNSLLGAGTGLFSFFNKPKTPASP